MGSIPSNIRGISVRPNLHRDSEGYELAPNAPPNQTGKTHHIGFRKVSQEFDSQQIKTLRLNRATI